MGLFGSQIFRHVERVKKCIPPIGDSCSWRGEGGWVDSRRIWQKSKWRNYSVDRRVESPWPVERVVEMKCSANNGWPCIILYAYIYIIQIWCSLYLYTPATSSGSRENANHEKIYYNIITYPRVNALVWRGGDRRWLFISPLENDCKKQKNSIPVLRYMMAYIMKYKPNFILYTYAYLYIL